jgi:hypothetical protein
MVLDAIVECNCYRMGKTKPFPLPELEPLFGQDEDGYLGLKLPYQGNEDVYERIGQWKENACEHPGMEYLSEHLSNWSGYRAFQEALGQVGWQHFPTLEAELPAANGGYMPSESAALVLKELIYFREASSSISNAYLIDTLKDERLHEYIASYGGLFLFAKPVSMGLDKNGFFLLERDENSSDLTAGKVVFRSKRFEQRILERGEQDEPRKVEFFDGINESRFITEIPLSIHRQIEGKFYVEYPQLLHVEVQAKGEGEFSYIVEPLMRLCEASIETGNPVLWC